MGTSLSYVGYVAEQIKKIGIIRYRKMFGEYMIYVDDKPAILVCDNQVFMKRIEKLKKDMDHLDTGYPYPGAKLHYLLNVDQKDEMARMVTLLMKELK